MTSTAERDDPLAAICRAEVVALHEFFTDWFCGRLPATDDAFARCERALGSGFQLISPRGVVDERAPLLEGIRAAHGRRRDFRIWIEDFAWRSLRPGQLGLATYVEWQEADGATSSRISTATMAADADAPGAAVWLHVHETWCQQAPPANADVPGDPLLAQFEGGALDIAAFTHERHVEVAWRYVRAYPLLTALDRFARSLRRFAEANGETGLYHETITWAYLLLINERVARADPGQDFAGFKADNQDIVTRGKHVLRQYYSDDILWSDLARKYFVWPDRSPLTGSDDDR